MIAHDFRQQNPYWRVSYEVSDNHRAGFLLQEENTFRYNTLKEALAVYQQMQISKPMMPLALRTYLQDEHPVTLFENHAGDNALVTDYRDMDVWKNNPELQLSIREGISRLGVEWQLDRKLIGAPILIPYEPPDKVLDEFVYYKDLNPRQHGEPLTSVRDVGLKDGPEDGIPFDEFLNMVASSQRGDRDILKVEDFFLQYRDPLDGEVALHSVEPIDFRNMVERYQASLEREHEMGIDERGQDSPMTHPEPEHEPEAKSPQMVLDYVGDDYWDRPVYEIIGTDQYVKDVNLGDIGGLDLHWSLPKKNVQGEPDYPFESNRSIRFVSTNGFELPENAFAHNQQSQDRPLSDLMKEAKERAEAKNIGGLTRTPQSPEMGM